MKWEPRPLPELTSETAYFWRAADEGQLVVRECEDCGLVYHYPRDSCPECLSANTVWRASNGTGYVYTYSVVHQLSGWPEDELPLLLAYVELDEGPRVLTNLVDCKVDDFDIGDRVEVMFVETGESNIAIPVFTTRE